MTLSADRITFREAEVARALTLELPAETMVHDRVLGRVIPVSRATSAAAFLNDVQDRSGPVPVNDELDALRMPSRAEYTGEVSSGRWTRSPKVIAGILVLGVLGLGLFLKGVRTWGPSGSGRA